MKQIRIHITGIVQGVGFRPFVYREAVARGIAGWVLNAGDGVHVEARASEDALAAFVRALRENAPAAARVDEVVVEEEREAPAASDSSAPAQGPENRPETPARTSNVMGSRQPDGRQAEKSAGGPDDEPVRRAGSAGDEPAFRIIASDAGTATTTLVSPDIATCPDGLRELFDPADRRYHYPFINCTNCGPRFTIIRQLPYDRAATSMDAFPMCPACAAEYADPLDRRFHAQPDACFECGPHLTWREMEIGAGARGHGASGELTRPERENQNARPQNEGCGAERGRAAAVGWFEPQRAYMGATREESDTIIARCAELLAGGGIVAVKGLGGFHLACNAADDAAVRALRAAKRRSNKPLAIMVADLATAREACRIDEAEEALLTGTIRPIVLLRRGGAPLAPSVAGDLPEVGIMLPYTPLQHLLLAACAARGVRALVMTSGNRSGDPIETDDAQAWEHLVESGMAQALLGNDRAILSRFDDSVARVIDGATRLVRRARGYAPRPINLPSIDRRARTKEHGAVAAEPEPRPGEPPVVLACGAQQKATLALTRELPDGGAQCLLSPHIGDIENAAALDAWHEARRRMEELFDLEPAAIACDRHPGYLSSQWARAEAEEHDLPIIEIQHHHAHVASVVAEAAAAGEIDPAQPVIGIALDGTGAGDDGAIWGGEVLVATLTGFERAAHLATWPLPGGAAAVRDARRNAFGLLARTGLLDPPGARPLVDTLAAGDRQLMETMIARGINCPLTSSAGRFLDAVAAILGISSQATYEGEPAIELEAAATRLAPQERAAFHGLGEALEVRGDRALDPAPMLNELLDRLVAGERPEGLAYAVHVAVATAFAESAAAIGRRTGIADVALSGGCFMNRLLLGMMQRELRARGLRPLVAREVPVNDGCIAYGQAAIARALLATHP